MAINIYGNTIPDTTYSVSGGFDSPVSTGVPTNTYGNPVVDPAMSGNPYTSTVNASQQTQTDSGWGMSGKGGMALGLGNIALGVIGYLDNKKTAGLQRKLLRQQYNNNVTTIKNRAEDRSAVYRTGGLGRL